MPDIIYPDESFQIMKVLFEIQNELGTKYQEKHYQKATEIKFNQNKIPFKKEHKIKINFKNEKLADLFVDFLIYDKIILEEKVVDYLHIDHKRQLLRYLISGNYKLGILVNFRIRPLEYYRIINPRYDVNIKILKQD